ncbi:ATP-binding protein [Bacillus cereus group sp. BfR-BA-01400]|uniref:ATP-binding protein n=1 Tax=Bacillus cereus group sp. BfR-BA-01400 TaxID=2920334 RepID=UPI001F583444
MKEQEALNNRKKNGAGAATNAGTNFQSRAAAWYAVHLLADTSVTPPLNLCTDTTIEKIYCETYDPVDDIKIGTSKKGDIYAQLKHSVTISESKNSDLASSIKQFVQQIKNRNNVAPLDETKDRLVLIAGRGSRPLKETLPEVLKKIRELPDDDLLSKAWANEAEKRVLKVIRAHAQYFWKEIFKDNPSEEDERYLFSLIRVQVLELDLDGSSVIEAKNILRNAVLSNPGQADLVWSILVQKFGALGETRGAIDRTSLQQALIHKGIQLKIFRSFYEDIEKLKRVTELTLANQVQNTFVRIGNSSFKLDRAVTAFLRTSVESNSLILTGEPGIGKSGILHELVFNLLNEKRDVLYFSVDEYKVNTISELKRQLELEHDFMSILENWPGTESGFIVIDALDSARSDEVNKTYRNLMNLIINSNSRWKVIVSIRTFDLRNSLALKKLFTGRLLNNKFENQEFKKVSHIQVPLLSDEELIELRKTNSLMEMLFKKGPSALAELLKTPFNLSILGDILDGDISISELSPISTQIELLDRYWEERVHNYTSQKYAREALLKRSIDSMIKNQQLSIESTEILESPVLEGPIFSSLLNDGVLIEHRTFERDLKFSFSHHVLFDYAVERLLIRSKEFYGRIMEQNELIITIRPSLRMHFQALWTNDETRESFWNKIFTFINLEIPNIGKVVGLMVACEMAKELRDFRPLYNQLASNSSPFIKECFIHLIRAINTFPISKIDTGKINVWIALLKETSKILCIDTAPYVIRFLSHLCNSGIKLSLDQLKSLGEIARGYMDYILSNKELRYLIKQCINIVCKALITSPMLSEQLLRRLITSSEFLAVGYDDLKYLVSQTQHFINVIPQFVEDLFKFVFLTPETRTTKTIINASQILPLVSNLKQDYNLIQHSLVECYQEFFTKHPKQGFQALLYAIEGYLIKSNSTYLSRELVSFSLLGRRVEFLLDGSNIWDKNDGMNKELEKMINCFYQYLCFLGDNPDKDSERNEIINEIITKGKFAVIWKRLLRSGSEYPETFGKVLLPLASEPGILINPETMHAAGEYLQVIYGISDENQRIKIEKTIQAVPTYFSENNLEYGEYIKNKLLGCLSVEHIVLESTQNYIKEIPAVKSGSLHNNLISLSKTKGMNSRYYFLEREGVSIQNHVVKEILVQYDLIYNLNQEYQNNDINEKNIQGVKQSLSWLWSSWDEDISIQHPSLIDFILSGMVEAAEILIRKNEKIDKYLEDILWEGLESSKSYIRRKSIKGLFHILRVNCMREDIKQKIHNLVTASDDIDIRNEIIYLLPEILSVKSDFVREILIERSVKETNPMILLNILQKLHLVMEDKDILSMVKSMYARCTDIQVRCSCLSILLDSFLFEDDVEISTVLKEVAVAPLSNINELNQMIYKLRSYLVYSGEELGINSNLIRTKAWGFLELIIASLISYWRSIPTNSYEEWDIKLKEEVKEMGRLINSAANQVYFASGAFSETSPYQDKVDRILNIQEKEAFFGESIVSIKELAKSGLPSVVHTLLKTLASLIDICPKEVFNEIGYIILCGKQGHYEIEKMGMDLVVSIVQRYLADHREVFLDKDCMKLLINILDIFAEVGWANPITLTYDLEQIYR